MLQALAARGASELRLADGCRPVFLFRDGERPVSQMVLSRAQILGLVAEIADQESAERVRAGGPVIFGYRLPGGSRFDCEVLGENGDFAVRVIPRDSDLESPSDSAPEVSPSPEPGSPEPTPGEIGTAEIDAYLRAMIEAGASDLHLSTGECPMLRVDGDISKMEGRSPLSAADTERLLLPIMPAKNKDEYRATFDTDLAYEISGDFRFRVNVFADRKGMGAVFRVIPCKIPTADDLGLPEVLLRLCELPKGLVLVTGPTGSGKSTTLAALVDHVNRTRSDHVITIEDPIEFVHPNRECLINQRQVGVHTESFKKALRAALREDPDIVLVGELRDLETVEIAIETAETGHLVLGTLHTTTAASTVDRIIDQFPPDRQDQIRTMLSESLRGVISQNLLKKIGGGRVAAMEILIGIPAISNLIREGKTYQIPSIMQTGKKYGMTLLNESLLDLVRRKVVTAEEAYKRSADKSGLAGLLRSAGFQVPVDGGP
jgi:twitching motility protein PilT